MLEFAVRSTNAVAADSVDQPAGLPKSSEKPDLTRVESTLKLPIKLAHGTTERRDQP